MSAPTSPRVEKFNLMVTAIGGRVQTEMIKAIKDQSPNGIGMMAGFMVAFQLTMSMYLGTYQNSLTETEAGNMPDTPDGRDASAQAIASLRGMSRLHLERLRQLIESANPMITAEAMGMQLVACQVSEDGKIETVGPMNDETLRAFAQRRQQQKS